MNDFDRFLIDVGLESIAARKKFKPFKSSHEAYAVILEELDEFWDYVKENKTSEGKVPRGAYKELVQVAAMCQQAALEIVEQDPESIVTHETRSQDNGELRSEKQ